MWCGGPFRNLNRRRSSHVEEGRLSEDEIGTGRIGSIDGTTHRMVLHFDRLENGLGHGACSEPSLGMRSIENVRHPFVNRTTTRVRRARDEDHAMARSFGEQEPSDKGRCRTGAQVVGLSEA